MNCPACGSPSSVTETRCPDGKVVQRRRKCDSCAERWMTVEKAKTAAILAVRRPHPSPLVGKPLPISGEKPAVESPISGQEPAQVWGDLPISGLRGVGGAPICTLDLGPNLPDPEADPDQTRALSVPPPAARVVYPVAFEAFWAATNRRGSKFKAVESWKKLRCPDADVLIAAWRAWERCPDWMRDGGQYQKHPVSWLNARMHEQEPPPDARTGALTLAPRTQQISNAAQEFLAMHGRGKS